jgi:hypothetical protein
MCRAIGTPNSMLRYVAKKVGHDLMPTGRVRRVQGIEIWGGTDAFLNQVEEALNRLQEHSASRGYSTVTGYIDRIEEDDTSGMLPDLKVRTMALSPVTAFANNSENLRALQWCASAIAHDAYHSMLYHSGQPYTGTEAELQCNAFQMEVCQDLGAPADMIEYVRQQDGRHHELPIYH